MARTARENIRISQLDLTLAWATCAEASSNGKGAITRTAAEWGLPPSIVQKALDRVEAAMGGKPFFVEGVKRKGRLTDRGDRFVHASNRLIEAWAATLEADLVDRGPPGGRNHPRRPV